jgi:hypothetical protein
VNFDPPQWLIDHSNKENGNSTAGLDYVFSHFCGIFMGTRACPSSTACVRSGIGVSDILT